MKSWYLEIKAQYFGPWFALSIVRPYTIQVNPLTGNKTNLSDRKGCAEKLSAGISIIVGWPVVTTWVTICCLFDQFWSNFSYFTDLSGIWTLIIVTNTKVFQFHYFFVGIFLGTGCVFWWVLYRTTRLNVQAIQHLKCVVLDLQAWKITWSKSCHFTKKHMEIASFCIDQSGFSHSFIVLTLFFLLSWISILYWLWKMMLFGMIMWW